MTGDGGDGGGDGGLRDYVAWHREYDDPGSTLSQRLACVQRHVGEALDARRGPLRVVSACSGDGRDIIGVLAARRDGNVTGARGLDAPTVRVTLLEIDPEVATMARRRAEGHGLADVEVEVVDAGHSAAYVGVVPADVVLLVGIMGNICVGDIQTLVATTPQFCRPGATVVWSRRVGSDAITEQIPVWFGTAGFEHVWFERPGGGDAGVGVARYVGGPVALEPGRRLFTFVR